MPKKVLSLLLGHSETAETFFEASMVIQEQKIGDSVGILGQITKTQKLEAESGQWGCSTVVVKVVCTVVGLSTVLANAAPKRTVRI